MKHQKAKVHFMLEINEIFGPTIQGEGKFAGNISMFIRFGKCNFRCPGFGVEYITPSGTKKCSCDSFHAVDTEFRESWMRFDNASEIIKIVENLITGAKLDKKPDIVITGGEPLLQWNELEFQKLLRFYVERDFRVTIETNASLDIELLEPYQKKLIFSASVKLSNSGESAKKRVNEKTLQNIANANRESYLKLVVDKNSLDVSENEIDEICKIVPNMDIYLMPKGDDAAELDKNAIATVELALKKGYKYTDRLHIRIWGNKRGV